MRILLVISFLVFPQTGFSDWVNIGSTKGINYYIDFDRLRYKNNHVFWWTLVDFSKTRNNFLSMKSYRQGDCISYKFRDLQISAYPNSMGIGNPSKSFTYEDGKWKYANPNTFDETMLDKVCKN